MERDTYLDSSASAHKLRSSSCIKLQTHILRLMHHCLSHRSLSPGRPLARRMMNHLRHRARICLQTKKPQVAGQRVSTSATNHDNLLTRGCFQCLSCVFSDRPMLHHCLAVHTAGADKKLTLTSHHSPQLGSIKLQQRGMDVPASMEPDKEPTGQRRSKPDSTTLRLQV